MYHFWNHILQPILTALKPSHIIEVGIDEAKTTRLIAEFAKNTSADVDAIDPLLPNDSKDLLRTFEGTLRIHEGTSFAILPKLSGYDVVFLDGDHNWHTVSGELHIIQKEAKRSGVFPTIFFHDVDWPYGRRDCFYNPARIPTEGLNHHAIGGLIPGQSALCLDGGLNQYMHHASHEGGPRNGVLTAIEDFLAQDGRGLRFHKIPGFFGLGILYDPKNAASITSVLHAFLNNPLTILHAEALEKERIQLLLMREKSEAMTMQKVLEERKIREHFYEETRRLLADREQLFSTFSWRMTAPLRSGVKFFNSLIARVPALQSIMRLVWKRQQRRVVSVSVIITAKNAMPYLRECFMSVRQQTVEPLEIIFMDHGSTDESVACAKEFPEVHIFSSTSKGVCDARNEASAKSRGDFLLFVDGDDKLSPSFIADHLAALEKDLCAGFAYGPVSTFGTSHQVFPASPWSVEHLWLRNFVCTSALIRRKAFEAVQGWKDSVGTYWDWDLFLRMSALFSGVPSNATLHYRKHEKSWSATHENALNHVERSKLHGRLRRAVAKVSIGAVYGGRLPELLPLWFQSIAESIRSHTEKMNPPEILIVDTSIRGDEVKIREAYTPYAREFSRITIVHKPDPVSGNADSERLHKLSQTLARSYTSLLAMAEGNIVWFIEDDVIVPKESFSKLISTLTDGAYSDDITLPRTEPVNIPAAVTGLYRCRHRDAWIPCIIENGISKPVHPKGSVPFPVDLSGTGCLMVLRALIPPVCPAYYRGFPSHDCAWSEAIRSRGYKILLDPSVRCRHYQNMTEFV